MQVGDKLFFVPSHRHSQPLEVSVLKVGRKWIELSNFHRVDVETLRADGGKYTSPGRCYLNKEAYETQLSLQSAWRSFQKSIDWTPIPVGVTADDIAKARQILRIEEKP